MNNLKVSAAKKLVVTLAIFSSIESFACGRSSVLDLRDVSEELVALYDQGKDVRCEIDRSAIAANDPMFNLHAIGKVTRALKVEGDADYVKSVKEQENKAWGTGFMISPCHMLTNAHVISKTETKLKDKLVNFSFGDNGSDFMRRVTGKVVTSGARSIDGSAASTDWAVVKISSLVRQKSVPYFFPKFSNLNGLDESISLGAGYPVNSLGANSQKIFGMKASLKNDNYYLDGKITFTKGNSGSPTLYMQSNRLVVSGIFANSENNSAGHDVINGDVSIVSLPLIKDQILNSDDRPLMTEIAKAIQAGFCE